MNTPTTNRTPLAKDSPFLKWLRVSLKTPVSALILACLAMWTVQVKGIDRVWLGTTDNNWDTVTSNWDAPGTWANTVLNTAVFGAGATPGTLTLISPITAGGLRINTNGYRLVGSTALDTLTLGSPVTGAAPAIYVGDGNGLTNNGIRTIIDAILAGSDGSTKTGSGTLVLGNTGNTYTGATVVKGGVLSITDQAQLGASNSTVGVFGVSAFGFASGSLQLQGGPINNPGMTFTRELSLAGRGNNVVGAALVSIGNNIISSDVLTSSATETRMAAVGGTTTFNGTVTLGAGANTVVYGNGNVVMSGRVVGSSNGVDAIVKTTSGINTTLSLTNNNNTLFGAIRADSGTIRVTDGGQLGLSNNITVANINFNNGTFEVRTDTPSSFATKNIGYNSNSGTLFVDHAIGSSLLGQNVTFANVNQVNNRANVFTGRNGYGVTFLAVSGNGSGANNESWANNSNGTVTFTGNLWGEADNAAARSLTLTALGEMVITGNIIGSAAAFDHTLIKGGTGTLSIGGSGTTIDGAVNISAGTLSIANVGGINNTAGTSLTIGNATTGAGTLTYTGGTATLSKNITINTTTGNAYINSSGSGALTLSGTFTNGVGVGGAHTVFLGGSNTADNTITSVITPGIAGAASLQKIGAGTWVLNPTASNTFTGSTTVSGGTLKLQEASGDFDILPNAGAVIFGTDTFTQAAGGTLNYIGASAAASAESVGALTLTSGSSQLQVTPTGGGSATLTFVSGPTTTTGQGASVNVLATAPSALVNVTGTADFVNAGVYFGSSDFAWSGAGTTLRAIDYVTPDAGVSLANVFAGGNHTLVNGGGTLSGPAGPAFTMASLKIDGGTVLDMDPAQTLTIQTAANTRGGILSTGGANEIKSGVGITSGGTGDLVLRVDGGSLLLSVPITATTTGGWTKTGGGTLIVNANNAAVTTTNAVNINEGTVKIQSGNLGANNVNINVRQGGTLDLNGVTTANNLNSLNGAGLITNTATGTTATITLGNAGGVGYFTGLLNNGIGDPTAILAVNKAGAGTLSLTGLNNFSGPLRITGGTIAATTLANIGSPSSIGAGNPADNAGSIVFVSGTSGTIQYTGTNATIFQSTQTPSVSIDRLFTINGGATGTIDSSGTYVNNVLATGVANNATLVLNNPGALGYAGSGTATLGLAGSSTGDNTFVPLITDSNFAVTKTGAGLWILAPTAGSNTYAGATLITAGNLRAQDGVGLSSSSNLNLNGGVLESTGSFTRLLGTAGGQVQWTAAAGGGFAASTGPLTVTLNGGSGLVWNSTPQFLTTGALILNSTTATNVVTFTNDLDLNAGSRTITVNDNALAAMGTDYAVITGAMSGAGASNLTKNGGGLLYLTGANTYNGNTILDNGQLAVTSIGSGGASSNLGNATGTLTLGAATAGTNVTYLMYYGAGETVTRNIIWNSTTGATTIDSSGSGPLALNGTFTVTGAGAKTLNLRGFNTDANVFSGTIAGTSTAVTKTDGGTWILTGANTYTGVTTAASGFLGLAGTVGGASGNPLPGALTMGNAGIFATDPAGITISNTVTFTQGQTSVFGGANSITLSGGVVTMTTGGSPTISNQISGGGVLTVSSTSGAFAHPDTTNNRTITLTGTGNTNWNLNLNLGTTGTMGFTIATDPSATTTIGGTGTGTSTGAVTLTQGNLVLARAGGADNVFGLAATGTFAFNGGTVSANSALTGGNAIVNPVTLGGVPAVFQGSNAIQLNAPTALALAASRSLVNNITGGGNTLTISGNIVNTATSTLSIFGSANTLISGVYAAGTGTNALQMLGTGTLTLTADNAYTGASTFTGGTTVLSGNGRLGDGAIIINQGAILTLDNLVSGNPGTADRLDNRALTMNGGTLNFIGSGAGSDEGTAGNTLTLGSGQSTINVTNNGGTTQMDFTTLTMTAAGAAANFTSNVALGTATNRIIFSTPPTLTPAGTGILPKATVAGVDFATYGANGIAAFAGYAAPANVNAALATDILLVNGATTTMTTNNTNYIVNALKLEAGVALGDTTNVDYNAVIVNTGGVISALGANTINSTLLNLGAEGAIHVAAGSLTINGALVGAAGFTKNLGGTLNLPAQTFVSAGATTVNGGILNLSAGNNTLLPGAGALTVNQTGVVNLNSSIQYVSTLSGGTNPGSGGTINLGATGLLVVNQAANGTWAGSINGLGNFAKPGGAVTLTVESAQGYSGTTTLMGGVTTLRDNATLLGTTSIDINYASLLLRNNDNLQTNITDRVNDAASITLRGGLLDFGGRANAASSETFGMVTAAQGANRITSTAGGTGTYNSAAITFSSLSRTLGSGSTVDFNGTILGQAGNQGMINFTTAPMTVGNLLLGPWAIVGSDNYAGYNNSMGVGAIGSGGFTQYDWQDVSAPNTAPAAGVFAAGNVTSINSNGLGLASVLLPGSTTTGMLRLGGNGFNNLAFTGGSDTLTLTLGGLLRSNNSFGSSIGTTATRGVINVGGAGLQELVVYNNATGNPTSAATFTSAVGSPIVTGAATAGFVAGMTVTNASFPAGTKIVSVDNSNQLTLSNNATAATATNTLISGSLDLGSTTTGSPVITMASTVGVSPGMILTGTGIPANSYVVSVDSATQLTISQNATANAGPLFPGGTVTFTAGMSNVVINSVIANNGNTAQLVKSGAGVLNLSAPNTYSGGTIINQGTVNLIGAPGVVVIPSSANGLTINGAIQNAGTTVNQTVQGSIGAGNVVTINGRGTLNLVGNNTLDSLVINNNGGEAAPTIAAGGILTLTNLFPVTASSSNAGTTAIISGGTLVFASGVNTITANPIAVGAQTYTTLQPTVNITSIITGTGVSIIKAGTGVLQLSGQSTFDGGVSLPAGAGGIMIGASSTAATRLPALQPVLTSGPLGTGTFSIGAGATILSSAAANAVANVVAVSGDFNFDGPTNVALNGNTSLGGPVRTINVVNPLMSATLGGIITNGAGGGIIKTGLGTLVLNNLNPFLAGDTVQVDNGILAGQLPGGAVPTLAAPSPFGMAPVTYNGGVLSVRTVAGDGVFGNNVNVNPALDYVNLDVQGGSMVTMGNFNTPMSAIAGAGTAGVTGGPLLTQVNVNGTNLSILKFATTNLDSNWDGGTALTRTAGQFQTFNVAAGVTTILMDAFARNNEPLNIGAGSLILGGANFFSNGTTITTSGSGAAPLANASTAIYGAGQTVTFTGTNINYSILPQTNAVIGGTVGGLQQNATLVNSGTLTSGLTFGKGLTSMANGVLPNDATLDRALSNSTLSTLGVFNGYINITAPGDYEFLLGSDDFSSLVIDGVELSRDITTGHGVTDTARGGLYLTAGQHSITYKINTGAGTANSSSGGGTRLLYSGPDTVASGTNGGWQAVSGANLSYFTGPAAAGNNFYNAAIIANPYVLSPGAVANLQGLGSDYNSAIQSLTMGAGSALSATNDLSQVVGTGVGGTGFLGVLGTTTVAAGAILAPTTANLYLIGGVVDGGNGITKTGNGVLHLNNSPGGTFTGALAINDGTVVLRENDALPTGGTTVAAASTTTFTSGATTNASNIATVASTAGMYPGMAIAGTGIPAGTTVVSVTNSTTFVMSANASATGSALSITHANASSLDLNGVASTAGRNVTLNGAGTTSQIGALYNSSATAATFAGNVTLATNSQIAGFGEMTISGAVTSAAGVTLTKAGTDTLTLTNTLNAGTLLGPVTLAAGVLNNGALNAGAGALGAGAITVTAGTLNLSGNNLAQALTIAGAGITNTGPNGNTGGAVINSSISSSVTTKNVVAPGSNMMTLPNTAATATVSNTVALSAASSIGSNTYATGGDIIFTNVISGTTALTKNGGNTLFLQGVNTFTNALTVNYGGVTLDGVGVLNGATVAASILTVNKGGTLTLDNVTTFTNNRLNNNVAANNRIGVLNGGVLSILGNGSTANDTTELLSASVVAGNTSALVANQGASALNLTPVSTGGSVALTLTRAGTGIELTNANSGTLTITGRNLGAGVPADGNANLLLTNGLTTNGLNIIGQNSNTANGGANNAATKGIAPWAVVDNGTEVNFATVDSVAGVGVRGLDTGAGTTEYTAANTNLFVAANNTLITAAAPALAVNAQTSLNSLKFTGGSMTIQQGTVLNLNSGGILATGSATISGPGIIGVDGTPVASTTSAGQSLYLWSVGGGTTLTVNAAIGSQASNTGRIAEIVKAGSGTVVLGGSNFTVTNTRVQEGILSLNNASALFYRPTSAPAYNQTSSSVVGQTLQVNAGGTVNMGGFDLPVNNLNSINPGGIALGSLSGGIITNAGTNRNLTINTTANNTWSGVIAGDINFAKYGNNTFTVTNSNTYDGTTIIAGGATTLTDLGAFRNTSGVTINDATLIWNDNSNQSDAYRLGAVGAAVTLNGGGFQYNGRLGESTVANLGAVTLASGASQFTTNAAVLGSATTRLASFSRLGNATVNFAGSVLGDDGNVIVTGAAPTNFNGIVGGWAITSSANPYIPTGAGDFVTYDPVSGFRAIVDYMTTGGLTYASGNSNQPALGNTVFGAGNNIRVNNTTTMLAGNNTANSMVIGGAAATTLSFAGATDTLFIQSGGILGSTDAQLKNIGGATAPVAANLNGYITAGNIAGSAGAGNPNFDLYLHNLANTLIVSSQIVDNGAAPVNLVTSMGSQAGGIIRFNNTNTYTGTTTLQTTDLRLNSLVGPAIANSLDIRILGGNANAADSSAVASNRILFEAGSQLNPLASVTIANASANLDLNNFSQTLASLTFNNIGGLTGTVAGASVRTGTGILTLTGGITATSLENLATIPFVAGNLNLTAGQHTVLVDPVVSAPQQIGLAINAAISGVGGIDKTGLGVLTLTGISTYTGPTNVTGGTLVLAGLANDSATDINMNLGTSRVDVSALATVDLRGGNAVIGSLAGAGTVTNSVFGIQNNTTTGNPATLTIGADGTSGADFSGRFTNFMNGVNETSGFNLNVTKIGIGNQIISGNNALAIATPTSNGDTNNTGTLDIQEGTITVNGANGSLGFTALNIRAGGVLTLDNSAVVKANRLGGFRVTDSANGDVLNDATTGRTIAMNGGTINFNAGASLMNEGTSAALSLATNPGVGSVTLASGASTWNFSGGTTNGVTVEVNSLTAGAGSLLLNAGATQTLGRAAAGASSINVYVAGGMATQGTGPLQPNGTAVLAPAGLAGLFVGQIRADVTGADSTGSGFVTYNRFGYVLLDIAGGGYTAFPVQQDSPLTTGGVTTPTNPITGFGTVAPTIGAWTGNAYVTEGQLFTNNTTIASLRLDAGGGLTSAGGSVPAASSPINNFNAQGLLNTTLINSGAIIANVGNTGLTGGSVSAGASAFRITTDPTATLNADTYLISTNVGNALVKEGTGTLNLNKRVFLGSATDAGATVVNGGFLNLSSGPNTLTVINSAGVSLADNLTINAGGVVDMKGNAQTIGNLTSADPLPGGGGTLQNTGALANLYTNSNATYGGTISGPITLYKTGANNLTLTSASTYTGNTNVQGGILILQDSGTLTSPTYNLNGGQLRYENRAPGLSEIVNRVPVGSTLNMQSGIFMDLGRETANQVTQTFATVNASAGYNEIRVDTGLAANRTLNIGALNVTGGAQVNFNTGLGSIGQIGNNVNINFDNFNPATMTIGTSTATSTAAVIPWATFSNGNTLEIAMYNPTINPQTGLPVGVVNPNQTVLGYTSTNYHGTNYAAATTGQNINQATSTGANEAAIVTSRAFNSLRYSTNTATVMNLARQELMRIEAGVIISAQTGLTINNGQITSGLTNNTATNFYITPVAAVAMNSQIVDNGSGALTLIKGGASSLTLNPQFAGNVSAVGAATSTVVGSNVITLAAPLATTPAVGSKVYGPGIPNGATVVSVAGASITISAPALTTQGASTFAFGDALAIGASTALSSINSAAASGAALDNTIDVTNAQAAALFAGSAVTGTGIPASTFITAIGAPNSGANPGYTQITITAGTASAAIATNATFTFGTGTIAAAASGAAIPTTMTVLNSIAAKLNIGSVVLGVGIPAGVTVTAIGAADSGGTGFTTITNSGGTASAAIVANQALSYGSAQVSTNSGYTGNTVVNQGALALNGAVGSRSLGGGSLTINTGGSVTMTNAGQIDPKTDVTINGSGTLTMAPVTVAEPTSGQINAINNLTFNNNGGATAPTVNPGAAGILTIKSGLITATGDNQGSVATVGVGAGSVLNFGQVSLGSWASGVTTVSVSDVAGFVVGQTVAGTGIAPGTTISSISGNVITLSTPTTGTSAATGSLLAAVNHASGSSAALAPTLNVISTDVFEVTADLAISAVIANSPSWTNAAGGGAALAKTGNGNLVLNAANTFDNGVNLTAGSITLANNAGLGTGKLSMTGGTTIMSDGTVRTITNAIDINGDVSIGGTTTGNGLTQTTGAINLGSSNRTVTVANPTVTASLGGVISGSGGLTKAGDGILTLNGANNYTGGTTVSAGLVNAGNATALGSTLNDLSVKANATLNINGNSLTVDGLSGGTATTGGLITNSGAAATLTVGNDNEATATFAGTITNAANALNVTKTGSGTQILTGTNTYTGTTTINGGVLQVGTNATGNAATLGSGAVTVNTGGTLAGTGHVLAPTAGTTLTVASGGILAPGDTAGASNGNLTLGSIIGNGLDPQAVTTAAASPSTVAGPVALTVADGGQARLQITAPTLNSPDVVAQVLSATYVDAATTFAGLATLDKQKWDGQAITQSGTGLVGVYTISLASLGLGDTVGGTGNGGVFVGQTVSGSGILGGTTITAINTSTKTVTLSNTIQAVANALTIGSTTQNVTLVEGLNSITLADATGLAVGDIVSGYGIASGAQVATITGNVITLKDGASGLSVVPFASTYAPTISFGAPGNYDHLSVSGALTLGTNALGTVSVLDNGYAATAANGDVFNLVDWSTITTAGTFAVGTNFRNGGTGGGDLNLPALTDPGLVWDVSAFASRGILVVVPEPSRMMLLFFGLVGLFLRRRRRRRE